VIALTLGEIVAATTGRLYAADGRVVPAGAPAWTDLADRVVDGPVTTDSRACEVGSLYVARVGEHADGHAYVPAAASRGAIAALTARPVDGLPCVVVEDTQIAFGQVARAVVDAAQRGAGLTIVGVTGSSGKTSTKDLLAHVLAGLGETVAPVESLNGEIGVPLTVCRITAQTRILVAEMGARGIGHIAYLTDIAPPRIGVVLNVGTAHVGEFGGRDQIALAKGELVESLPDNGIAVLNADDPTVAAMSARTKAKVVLVGEDPSADVRATDVVLDALGRPSFMVHTPAGTSRVQLGLHGRHHVGNALGVLAVALELGQPLGEAVARLATARPVSRWRMEVFERADGITIVNDAYNANPDSMAALLRALAAIGHPESGAGRRTWAVLGEMLELGPDSVAEHEGVGRLAAQLGVDRLLAVGAGAAAIADGARAGGLGADAVATAADVDAAYDLLVGQVRPGDVVAFKSSRDSGLRWLGDRFAQDSGRSAGREEQQ